MLRISRVSPSPLHTQLVQPQTRFRLRTHPLDDDVWVAVLFNNPRMPHGFACVEVLLSGA